MILHFGSANGPITGHIPDQWQAVTCDMTGGQTRSVFTLPTTFMDGSNVIPFVRFYGCGDITYRLNARVMEPETIDDGVYEIKQKVHFPVNKFNEMRFVELPVFGGKPSIEIKLSRWPWPMIRPICFGIYFKTDKFGLVDLR